MSDVNDLIDVLQLLLFNVKSLQFASSHLESCYVYMWVILLHHVITGCVSVAWNVVQIFGSSILTIRSKKSQEFKLTLNKLSIMICGNKTQLKGYTIELLLEIYKTLFCLLFLRPKSYKQPRQPMTVMHAFHHMYQILFKQFIRDQKNVPMYGKELLNSLQLRSHVIKPDLRNSLSKIRIRIPRLFFILA